MDSSGSNLSQYFANDPPSFFDDLASKTNNCAPPTGVSQINNTSVNATKPRVPPPPPPLASSSSTNTMPFTGTAMPVAASQLITNTFSGGFQAPEYMENQADLEEEHKISDDVRNFWQSPQTESGMPPLLTMPGIHSPHDLPDSIAQTVSKHLGEAELSQRKILTVDQVTQDERGLRNLIYAGCYRAAVNLTGRLLTIYGQGYGRAGQPAKHSPHSLQLWFTRLALLAKLGEFELLQAEAEPFEQLNRLDVFYEFYPEMYSGKQGSIACFSFRLLLAELPIHWGKPHVALDLLSELSVICNDIKQHFNKQNDKNAVAYWQRREERALHSIINCALMMKKFNMIDDIMSGMLLSRLDLTKDEQRALYSAWGRIYLQIGDIFGAEQKFAIARRLTSFQKNSAPDLRDLVDKGLITVAKNDFPEAYAIFQKALHLESGNTMILNNMGVCLLYAGKLKDAINLYERAININPQKSLNESLMVNLSTLYELESNNSRAKKLNLLRLINKYKPDLNLSIEICLKLQTP